MESNLDELVMKYQETKDERYINEILTNHQKLFYYLLALNGIKNDNKNSIIVGMYTYDDFYSLSLLSFTKAIQSYDGEESKFTTYFSFILRNDIIRIKKKYNNESNTLKLSFDSPVKKNTDGNDIYIGDLIEDVDTLSEVDDILKKVAIENILHKVNFTDIQAYVFEEYFINNKSYDEIAKQRNVTKTCIATCIKYIIKKIKNNI